MTRFNRLEFRVLTSILLFVAAHAAAQESSFNSQFALIETEIPIQQIDLQEAVYRDSSGYPRIDWPKFQNQEKKVIERRHRAVILENRYVRVMLLPEMGRVYSFFSKITSHEQFWINKIAKPIGALNDTGWWMIWGGVEYTVPRGEHGTTWALPWRYQISENSRRRKGVKMTVLEPATKLAQTLEISIEPNKAFYEAEITIANTSDRDVKFAHWVNPMWAPGGRGELTSETELIVPCTAMLVLDRDFNRWMLGNRTQEYERNPLRFVKHWRSIGDLLAQRLTDGFYGAFSHETNEGVVRIFDPQITPGMDIWTWGFPPPPGRQRDFSEVPNLGYVEMWGGTARDFSDDSRETLGPGMRKHWKEWMYACHQIGGLTYANNQVAVNFKHDAPHGAVDLGVFVTSPQPRVELDLRMGKTVVLRKRLNLSPEKPFHARIPIPKNGASELALPQLILRQGNRTLATLSAKLAQPLQWNFPYLPEESPKP